MGFLDRLKFAAAGAQGGIPSPEPQDKPKPTSRIPWWAKLCVVLVVACGVGGFFHVTYGGGTGIGVCTKDGWALEDTFVDLDDYVGKPLISKIDKAKVLRALFACGKLKRPDLKSPEDVGH